MQKTLGEIAKYLDGEAIGDLNLTIAGVSGIKEAQGGDLTFLANPRYLPLVKETRATAIIVPRDIIIDGIAHIRIDNPSLAFSKAAALFRPDQEHPVKGVHETAVIASGARLGRNVAIGPYTIVEHGAVIGDHTLIYGGCYVGQQASIGTHGLIYPHVVIREGVSIGNKVIIHSGTVIGCDGFGFVDNNGIHEKIPQSGTVCIEDDVEIGANVTIDRARFDKTFIGRGTKIDNLVQIAHNVKIGQHCIIVAQVGISGSTTLQDRVILAGQVGIAGHLTIGEGAVVASQSGVPNDIPPHTTVWGYPAKPHMHAKRVNACVQRLPEYVKTIRELKSKVEELEKKLVIRSQL
jgi:UDP-3-O-[3-hydroxymyristoyl] glucosamine N-acyltransferase